MASRPSAWDAALWTSFLAGLDGMIGDRFLAEQKVAPERRGALRDSLREWALAGQPAECPSDSLPAMEPASAAQEWHGDGCGSASVRDSSVCVSVAADGTGRYCGSWLCADGRWRRKDGVFCPESDDDGIVSAGGFAALCSAAGILTVLLFVLLLCIIRGRTRGDAAAAVPAPPLAVPQPAKKKKPRPQSRRMSLGSADRSQRMRPDPLSSSAIVQIRRSSFASVPLAPPRKESDPPLSDTAAAQLAHRAPPALKQPPEVQSAASSPGPAEDVRPGYDTPGHLTTPPQPRRLTVDWGDSSDGAPPLCDRSAQQYLSDLQERSGTRPPSPTAIALQLPEPPPVAVTLVHPRDPAGDVPVWNFAPPLPVMESMSSRAYAHRSGVYRGRSPGQPPPPPGPAPRSSFSSGVLSPRIAALL